MAKWNWLDAVEQMKDERTGYNRNSSLCQVTEMTGCGVDQPLEDWVDERTGSWAEEQPKGQLVERMVSCKEGSQEEGS